MLAAASSRGSKSRSFISLISGRRNNKTTTTSQAAVSRPMQRQQHNAWSLSGGALERQLGASWAAAPSSRPQFGSLSAPHSRSRRRSRRSRRSRRLSCEQAKPMTTPTASQPASQPSISRPRAASSLARKATRPAPLSHVCANKRTGKMRFESKCIGLSGASRALVGSAGELLLLLRPPPLLVAH